MAHDIGQIAERLANLERVLAGFDRTKDGANGNSDEFHAEALKLISGPDRAKALAAIREGLVSSIAEERSRIVKAIKAERTPSLRLV